MKIEFDSLTDLDNFFRWVAKRGAPVMVQLPAAETLSELVDEVAAEIAQLPEIEAPKSDRDLSGPPVAEMAAAAEAKPARKRRTKAEMEAARAADAQLDSASQTGELLSETTPAGTQAAIAPENTANPFAQQELPADSGPAVEATPAPKGELIEFMAARLAERPEVSQIEHLNLARAFISKHGMPKYNESFALVGLSSNVMTFGPTECAKHAAVLDFLASE